MSGPAVPLAQDDADDLQAAVETIDEMDLNPFDLTQPRGFAGLAEAGKSLLRPSASAGRTAMFAGANVATVADFVANSPRRMLGLPEEHRAADWYFEHVVDDVGSNAVDFWTPDVAVMGSAARAVSNVGTVAGAVPEMIGAPALFLADAAIDPAADLVRGGVDATTASGVGAMNLAVNAVGLRMPAAFGRSLSMRMATGAGTNLVTGVAADAASAELLERRGYADEATRYDPSDPYARGLDTLMGLAFGVHAHVGARVSPAQRDAALVAMNADHAQRATMPGAPLQRGADVRHQQALNQAIQQIVAGERVDVAAVLRDGDFDPPPTLSVERPQSTSAPMQAPSYPAYRRALESGGDANARNPRSTAFGIDQFTAVTWRAIVAKAKPVWAQGLSDTELLALRRDPGKSGEMAAALDAENERALRASGLEPSHHNLYAAHHFGAERAIAFGKAAGDTPMASLLSASQIKANPYLAELTKAQAIANWDARARRAGVDHPRSEPQDLGGLERAAPRDSADSVTQAEAPRTGVDAAAIIDARIESLRAASQEGLLPAGEVKSLATEADELDQLLRAQDRAATDGVMLAPESRLTPGERAFAEQRRGEIRQQLERHKTARAHGDELTKLESRLGKIDRDADLIALSEQLQPQRTANVGAETRTAPREPHAEHDANHAPARVEPSTDPAPVAAHAAGERATAARAGASEGSQRTASTGDAARASSPARRSPTVERARAFVARAPDARIPTGDIDANGAPITIPATELLAQADVDAQRAALDAEALQVAAECFLRTAA